MSGDEIQETRRKILNYISENPECMNKDISEGLDLDKSTVSHHVSKLKENNYLQDISGHFGNQSKYVVADEIQVNRQYDYDHLLDNLKIHFVESFFIVLLVLAYNPLTSYIQPQFVMYAGMVVVLLPSLIRTLYRLDKEDNMHIIQVHLPDD